MNIITKLLEDYVNFVDMTKKQNKYFKTLIFLIAIITVFGLFFLLNVSQSSNYTITNRWISSYSFSNKYE